MPCNDCSRAETCPPCVNEEGGRRIRITGNDPVPARKLDVDSVRRERYAAAIANSDNNGPEEFAPTRAHFLSADAAMAVADDDIRSAVSHVVEENARLREQLDRLRGQLDTARAVTNRETEENARLRAELEEAREECRVARRREVRYNADLDQAQVEIARLRAELDENTGVLKALRRQRDKAEATISRVRAVLDNVQNPTDELNVRAALDSTDS